MSIDLDGAIKLGNAIGDIIRQLQKLEHFIGLFLLKHNLRETISDRKSLHVNKNELFVKIKPIVKDINDNIQICNEFFTFLEIKNKIKKLSFDDLYRILNDRFGTILNVKSHQSLGNENFRMKLHLVFYGVTKSINEVLIFIENDSKIKEFSNLKRKYKMGMIAANNIRSFGCHLESIFVVGRTIELILDDLLRKAMKENKIKKKISLRKIKYQDKIGILKNLKIIDEKSFHELNSVRIYRNETGHPIKQKYLKSESKIIIEKSVFVLDRLQRKL